MVNLRIGIIIQARMGSNRLAGKILLKLPYNGNTSILEHIINRAKKTESVHQVIVATSTNSENDILEVILKNQCDVFRGSEHDVLSRYYEVAKKYNFDVVVRLTGDNPFYDSQFIDQVVQTHINHRNDYTCSKGLPIGMNIEVMSFDALKDSYEKGLKPPEKEHVTLYLQTNTDKYKCEYIEMGIHNTWRLTVDNPNDYALACLLYKNLYVHHHNFGYQNIIEFIKKNEWCLQINQDNIQIKVYDSLKEEKTEAIQLLNKYGFTHSANVLENI